MKMSFLNALIALVVTSVLLAAIIPQSKKGESVETPLPHPADNDRGGQSC